MKRFATKQKIVAAGFAAVLVLLLLDALRRRLPFKVVLVALLAWGLAAAGIALVVVGAREVYRRQRGKPKPPQK